MKLATLKKDTYFVDRYGEWVAVRAGAVVQVEEQQNGEYMLHAPRGVDFADRRLWNAHCS